MSDLSIRFAINHMVAPQLSLDAFFGLARALGVADVEIRNDISGEAIADGTSAGEVRQMADSNGVSIISINALQKFNHWSETRRAEAESLADYAVSCGSQALVLVAANDDTGMGDDERIENATEALLGLKPILHSRNIIGLVECLGFETSSLRKKSEAVSAIDAADGREVFRLIHDTFHHHLAGEAALFPGRTGLIHISGVDDPAVTRSNMRDSHRVLVGTHDRLGSIAQIKSLRAAGADVSLSFEPFAAELRTLADPAGAIRQSMEFIRSTLGAMAA